MLTNQEVVQKLGITNPIKERDRKMIKYEVKCGNTHYYKELYQGGRKYALSLIKQGFTFNQVTTMLNYICKPNLVKQIMESILNEL